MVNYNKINSYMSTNFEKVVDFNTQFGVIQSKELIPNPNILEQDPVLIERCMKLIREEMAELEKSIKDKDFVEFVDGLADIMYVVLGAGSRVGVNMDYAFDLVHTNNMSKLCKTEDEAQRSVQSYIDGERKDLGYKTPTYRKAPDDIHWVVYNESDKKVLKSIEWKEVDLKPACGL